MTLTIFIKKLLKIIFNWYLTFFMEKYLLPIIQRARDGAKEFTTCGKIKSE